MTDKDFELRLGAQFSTFQAFDQTLQKYQDTENQSFSRKRSRKITAAGLQRTMKEDLIYYEMSYICKLGGTFKSKGKGQRNTSSGKIDCPAYMNVKVSKDGQYLEIRGINLEHNHPALKEYSNLTEGMDLHTKNQQAEPDVHTDIEEMPATVDHQATQSSAAISKEDISDDTLLEIAASIEVMMCEQPHLEACFSEDAELISSHEMLDELAPTTCKTQTQTEANYTSAASKIKNDSKKAITMTLSEIFMPYQLPTATCKTQTEAIFTSSTSETEFESEKDTTQTLAEIFIPDHASKGRPKGTTLTVIGLPKRRKGPVSFTALSDEDKAYQILSWITPDESMPSRALSGEYQLKPEDVETRPEMIPDSLGADDVSLEIVQPYLEKEAFRSLCGAVRSKKNMNIWTCRTCGSEAEEDCALCESCLAWYHFKCVGFKLTKKNQRSAWFCPTCKIVK